MVKFLKVPWKNIMDLKTYHKKRDFNQSPEPEGKPSSRRPTKKLLFSVQKHDASHLHYDLRLELNGVLLSWAVPKGPSLDPSVKRLAMHVEDHPLEYGTFEGIIPKGHYGAGTVMLWDKGEWVSTDKNPLQSYRKGDLSFTLKGKKLHGNWKLIRINNNDKTWLLIKVKDQYAKSQQDYDITLEEPDSVIKKQKAVPTVKLSLKASRFPQLISPELATLVDEPPTGKDWLHEIKFDGYRLIAFRQNANIQLFTRNHQDWTLKFKNIRDAINELQIKNIILDGEVVMLDKNQHSNFQLLQNAINEKEDSLFIYYVFDLLYFDKYDLTSLSLIERKKILKNIIPADHSVLRFSDHVSGNGKKVFSKSCDLGLEGIVSKKTDSVYLQKRTRDWLKIKCIKRQEFFIGGFSQPKNMRNCFGSLLLGTYNKRGELVYNGNVGTGFTQASLKSVYQELIKRKTDKMPFNEPPPSCGKVTWVKPVLEVEIEFTEWTEEGYLRHPSFKGLREDKSPVEIINRESPMPLVTHPDKILYPEDGITKQEIADYYYEIQKWILPYIIDRPLTLVRCPNGYHHCFYQKHINTSHSPDLYRIAIKEKKEKSDYLYIKDSSGLLLLTQMGTLEIHPWSSQITHVEHPDMIIFDLDPAPDVEWKNVVKAAFDIKSHLEKFKLKCFVKTTGGKGLHIVIPIKPEYDWSEIKNFTHTFVDFLVLRNPKSYVSKASKEKRKGKIFIDYLRNQRGATAIAPYSTRAREQAPVAAPLHWDELTRHYQDTFFTIKTLPARLEKLKKDPWKDFFKLRQSLNLEQYQS